MAIDPKASVHPDARLGRDVEVGPFALVGAQVELGDGCRIGPHAVVLPYTRLGVRNRVHAGAVLGDLPQDAAFDPATVSHLVTGADCVFREGVTVHRGTKPGTDTRLGDRCLLMANSHVGHNGRLGDDVIMANGALLGGYVELQDRVFVSGNCVVHQFCRVGRLAMLSGLSAASKDVPPYCILDNSATNQVAGLNVVGMRRAGLGAAERLEVKQAFDLLYRSGLNTREALSALKQRFPEGPAAAFWVFGEQSTRGLCGFIKDS
jgi:UDP-N-acetylglucosamine acyltransferase